MNVRTGGVKAKSTRLSPRDWDLKPAAGSIRRKGLGLQIIKNGKITTRMAAALKLGQTRCWQSNYIILAGFERCPLETSFGSTA